MTIDMNAFVLSDWKFNQLYVVALIYMSFNGTHSEGHAFFLKSITQRNHNHLMAAVHCTIVLFYPFVLTGCFLKNILEDFQRTSPFFATNGDYNVLGMMGT